jgi:hypothetical protein
MAQMPTSEMIGSFGYVFYIKSHKASPNPVGLTQFKQVSGIFDSYFGDLHISVAFDGGMDKTPPVIWSD